MTMATNSHRSHQQSRSHSPTPAHSQAESHVTTDHETIRRWVEERNGKPSHVKSTASPDEPGILRIDFPDYSEAGSLGSISWAEFFEKFEKAKLAFLYQEKTADGHKSNFNKLISRQGQEK